MENLILNRFTENLPLGSFMLILGLCVIFFGMAVIVLVVTIIGKIMTAKANKAVKPKQESTAKEVAPIVEEEGVPEHVKVAIVAAITAYYFNQGSNCEFKIKKIKRI